MDRIAGLGRGSGIRGLRSQYFDHGQLRTVFRPLRGYMYLFGFTAVQQGCRIHIHAHGPTGIIQRSRLILAVFLA